MYKFKRPPLREGPNNYKYANVFANVAVVSDTHVTENQFKVSIEHYQR